MRKYLMLFYFFLLGIFFGIDISQSGFLSSMAWQNMFLFRDLSLVGIILSANMTGMIGIQLIKRFKVKNYNGAPIEIPAKTKSFYRYAIGGLIFGIGWTIAGCPGTTYTLIGHGNGNIIIVIAGALTGTIVYALIKKYLPH